MLSFSVQIVGWKGISMATVLVKPVQSNTQPILPAYKEWICFAKILISAEIGSYYYLLITICLLAGG